MTCAKCCWVPGIGPCGPGVGVGVGTTTFCGGGGSCSGGSFLHADRASALARVTAMAMFLMTSLSYKLIKRRDPVETSLRQDRSPGGVGGADGGRQAPLVAPGEIDLPDRGLARVARGAEELDDAAVGRPGRR